MIKAILIDDEDDSRENLLSLLQKYCPHVEVLAACHTPEKGMEAIRAMKPALVFLDIEMPGMTGFDLLEKLSPVSFEVIFTTAFNQYAIRAIRFSALDFLLKPVIAEELIKAVSRFELKKQSSDTLEQMKLLLSNLKNPKGILHKIAIPTLDGMIMQEVNDIIRLEADGSYTRFITPQGSYLVSRTMKEYDDLLAENNFLRVHHGHLINLNFVKKYVRSDGGYIVLNDGTSIPISVRKKAEVLEKLANF